MGTPHIEAKAGDIAEKVIMPGDPLRAKFIAETFLENPVCYNTVRGMLGYTGTYKGKRVSVQGAGMGMPSMGIYAWELINEYGAKRLIRTGTCGSQHENFRLGDVIIAQAAATDSGTVKSRFGNNLVIPAVSDFKLLRQAVETAEKMGITPNVGTVYSSDLFYGNCPDYLPILKQYGIGCVEMECAELFTLGARYGVQTLGILTVSDQMYDGKCSSPEERQKSFTTMMKLALETI